MSAGLSRLSASRCVALGVFSVWINATKLFVSVSPSDFFFLFSSRVRVHVWNNYSVRVDIKIM